MDETDKGNGVTDELPDDVQRWTAKRRATPRWYLRRAFGRSWRLVRNARFWRALALLA